ncbi:phage tail assembly protein [Magnetospirillum fulvum]|uniref:Putative phage related protein n=1 Tax=Magnetospirillum fulvum MGU-K5 TaxID=1316936 RepID=S9S610_MAGFU|nr:phage tail assembly protein [Magnetospirillum fulvum]EPY01352.1 putative phage related protein [Magnetospirillum fulvum MGU-K5]
METKTTTREDGLAVHTFPLVRPRTVAGVRYTSLSMVEPHVNARMQVPAEAEAVGLKEVETAMVAILCNVPVELVKILSMADYQKVQATLSNFPYPEAETSEETSSASPV